MSRNEHQRLRLAVKTGALSPAVNQMAQPVSPEDEKRLFEDKMSQMAYQVFSAQHPDLSDSIITFKVIDADVNEGRGLGSFILDHAGQTLYVPVVLSENQLKPLDMVYLKEVDRFVPFTPEWIEAAASVELDVMGEGGDLPKTLATDVDIRNIIVPPTTGRYSYASAGAMPELSEEQILSDPYFNPQGWDGSLPQLQEQYRAYAQGDPTYWYPGAMNLHQQLFPQKQAYFISPRAKLAAESTEPLGRKVHKLAQIMPPPPQMAQAAGAPAPAQGSENTNKGYDPELWSAFTEQFMRISGQSPGQALDAGSIELDALTKMYRSHQRTWEMAQQARQMSGANPGMVSVASAQEKTANRRAELEALQQIAHSLNANVTPFRSGADHLADLWSSAGRGAAIGGITAGGTALARDEDFTEVPSTALRGALAGALLGPAGKTIGRTVGMGNLKYLDPDVAATVGGSLGAFGGGLMGVESRPETVSQLLEPSPAVVQHYYRRHPEMVRYASDQTYVAGIKDLVKHAASDLHRHDRCLPTFLTDAPNAVKQAFAAVLQNHPKLLKFAADTYGEQALITALTPKKEAGIVQGKGLYVADKDTPADELFQSFGAAAPEAFKGIALRGYYFKDTRPSLNLAVQVQEFHDFTDAKEPGAYFLYRSTKRPSAALVLYHPLNLMGDDRHVFPGDETKKVPVYTRIKRDTTDMEPNALEAFPTRSDVARSHQERRMAILGNGDFTIGTRLMGEQCAEIILQGTPLFSKVLTDKKASPRAGLGCFVYKTGTRYGGTLPVKLSQLSTREDGVLTGVMEDPASMMKKKFIMDPRSPNTRARRPANQDFVILPASWKWMPLKKRINSSEFLHSPKILSEMTHNALNSMGVHKAVAVAAGQRMYDVSGGRTITKNAAIAKLATDHAIHASAAEAMLKIADLKGKCEAIIIRPSKAIKVANTLKVAQGMADPAAAMPPAMQQPQPSPAMAPPEQDAVSVAFGEVSQDLMQQMGELQAMLGVLEMVQQRAAQLTGGMPAAPAATDMQGMPAPMPGQPMTPEMAASPQMGAQPMPGQPMPPGMGMPVPQGPAVMRTEGPSAVEIQSQINPQFLENAALFADQGAFDTGAISSLTQNPSLRNLGSQYAANFEDSLDDLGRTLLTMYMQEGELKEQLGDDAYVKLETQLRDTFSNLGDLVLALTHNTAMLHDAAVA